MSKWWGAALHLRRVNRAEAVIAIVAKRARESVMTGLGRKLDRVMCTRHGMTQP